MNSLRIPFLLLLALIALKLGIVNAIFAFFLVGAIPGTTFNLPPSVMLIFYLGLIALVIEIIFHRSITKYLQKRQSAKRAARMPRRRYGQI